MTPREEALVAAGVRRAVLQWKAEASLRRKLAQAGADAKTIQREAERLSDALRGSIPVSGAPENQPK